ncbi:MAG: sensor histidine kinase [Myxococcus sp.]|nr:sensor histidine kinase [Myxococcus sp.]
MPSTVNSPEQLRSKAALSTVRSVLVGLILLGLLGIIAAVASYRADVAEARGQVHERVGRQGRLYADSLALHFEVLRAELKLLADRGMPILRARGPGVLTSVTEDRNLFADGVVLFDLEGNVVWQEPGSLVLPPVTERPWFQQVLRGERGAVDQVADDENSRLAVALPVRGEAGLEGVLVGLVAATDKLLYGADRSGEQLLLLGSSERVLVPLAEPAWSRDRDFGLRVEALRRSGGDAAWRVGGHEVLAGAFAVRGTGLQVLALESEETSVSAIRTRLNVQLAFLLGMQLAALGAFVIFLRRTWRAFLDAEARVAEQETMAALGSAASLIAHEVKNSLNGLNAATSMLGAPGAPALASRIIRGQVDRLSHLARSLLSFSRPPVLQRVPLALDAVVRETVAGLSALPEWPEVEVVLDLQPDAALRSDPLLITTVTDNLVRNAIEAAVAAKDVGLQPAPRVEVSVLKEGERLVLRVDDNAGSADKGLDVRLGQPFFTTKSKGIGLGLAMTSRAVDQLGAQLKFQRLAHGSRFEVTFPAQPPADGGAG